MKKEYRDWIEEFTKPYGKRRYANGGWYSPLRGMCGSATLKMQAVFPELIRVPGIVKLQKDGFNYGSSEHWWLRTVQGNIVDPTVGQFLFCVVKEYHPWPKDVPIPTGKCPNCGELCYNNQYFCTEACGVSYAAYVEREIRR